MSLVRDLLERPADLPLTSKYTVVGGLVYLAAGVLLLVWPGAAQTLFRDRAFVGHEEGLMRAMGMTVMVIGWFYLFGARTGARQFVAATVFDRGVLVPLVLLTLAFAGVFPHLFVAFAILDVALGLGAWWLLSRSSKEP
ncbi:MAG TPA: hypothetical protein VGG92_01700 [Caulobacteraceae bacterium]|jgi:uncharacterized protein YjeT (DUF2065 family)